MSDGVLQIVIWQSNCHSTVHWHFMSKS